MDKNKLIVTLRFYDEVKPIYLPFGYNDLIFGISEILQIPKENLNKISMFYIDKENDKITVTSDMDYSEFMKQVIAKEVNSLFIELVEEQYSGINQEMISNSFEILNGNSNPQINNNMNNNNNNNRIKLDVDICDDIKDNIDINNNINNNINKNINNNNINNNNIINNNNLNNNINNNVQNGFAFNVSCINCKKQPIISPLYQCPVCHIYLCSNCEHNFGHDSDHPLIKIKNNSSFHYAKIIDNRFLRNKILVKTVENVRKRGLNVFEKINKIFDPNKFKTPIEQFKSMYDLRSFSDLQIQDALNRTNNNFDEAIAILAQLA